MSTELTKYESITRRKSCSCKLKLNKYVSKEQVEKAIYILTKEYSFLSSEYKEGTNILEYKENYHPPTHYHEKSYDDSDYWVDLKKATEIKTANTSEYFIYADKSKDETGVMVLFNHGMVDGISCLNLAHKFCLHLSDPTVEVKKHDYVSAQGRIKIPEGIKYENYLITEDPYLTLPTYLHECFDYEELYYRVHTGLIGEDDLKEILKYIHDVHCSFQGLLWICELLSQMKLFKIDDFSKLIRFHSMATSRGRAEFEPPILADDTICSGFYSYVTKKLAKEDKITDVIVDLTTKLHDQLKKKQQMYDFFIIDDYNDSPKYTITGCTMGRRPNQKHYEGKFSFDVLHQDFIVAGNRNITKSGMVLFFFTVPGVGCYISNNYLYPQFTDEEVKGYVENMIKMMKYCSKKGNKDITIADLMKI